MSCQKCYFHSVCLHVTATYVQRMVTNPPGCVLDANIRMTSRLSLDCFTSNRARVKPSLRLGILRYTGSNLSNTTPRDQNPDGHRTRRRSPVRSAAPQTSMLLLMLYREGELARLPYRQGIASITAVAPSFSGWIYESLRTHARPELSRFYSSRTDPFLHSQHQTEYRKHSRSRTPSKRQSLACRLFYL